MEFPNNGFYSYNKDSIIPGKTYYTPKNANKVTITT